MIAPGHASDGILWINWSDQYFKFWFVWREILIWFTRIKINYYSDAYQILLQTIWGCAVIFRLSLFLEGTTSTSNLSKIFKNILSGEVRICDWKFISSPLFSGIYESTHSIFSDGTPVSHRRESLSFIFPKRIYTPFQKLLDYHLQHIFMKL